MPSQQPLLPAYHEKVPMPAFNDKTQTLIVSRGCAVDALDMQSGGSGNPLSLPQLPYQQEDAIARKKSATQGLLYCDTKLPKWILHDRKVLRWYGYFCEMVALSAIETYRIRHVTMHFYLSDDTLEVVEPREENSGMSQGVLVKRHRIPCFSRGEGAFYEPHDLLVGGKATIYGRTISITGADASTRAYMQQLGVNLAPDMQSPQSPHNPAHVPGTALRLPAPGSRSGAAKTSLKDYLENSNKVLRFFCVWDNRSSLHSQRRHYRLHFYIEDFTCEIVEDRSGSTRDAAPIFLKRGLLPKHAPPPDPCGVIDRSQCYTAPDFRIGATISVFGRCFLIHSCDDFTRTWLQAKLGWSAEETASMDVSEHINLPHPRQLPPHNGFGSEEDSAQNCISLNPKAPRKDFQKLLDSASSPVLLFTCRLCQFGSAPLAPTELGRRFVLSYFLSDDTLAIFEPPLKNSGFLGGRYLERRQVCWPGSSRAITSIDLHVGAVLPICQRSFELLEADERTLSHLESHCATHPHADGAAAVLACAAALKAGGKATLEATLAAADPEGCGYLPLGQLTAMLQGLQPHLSRHQVIVISRQLPKDSTGRTSVAALRQALGL